VFGPELTILASCDSDLVLQDLLFCPKLKSLLFLDLKASQLLDSGEKDLLWNPVTFLPKLTEFRSSGCLGKWSQLFENIPSLVGLSLRCCHIGLNKDGKGSSDRLGKRLEVIIYSISNYLFITVN